MANEILCFCSRRCGGPGGGGRLKAPKTVQKHAREERDYQNRQLLASTSEPNRRLVQLTTDTAASDRVNPSTLDLLDVGSAANTRKRQPQREPTPPHAHPQDKRARLQSHRDPSEDEISNPQQPLDLEEYEVPPPGTPRPEDVDPLNEEDYERTNSEREDARASAVPEGLQDVETQAPRFNPVLHDIQVSLRFIELLKEAALDSTVEPLPADVINQIRNPPLAIAEVDDPDTRYSLELFFALTNASKDEYNNSRAAYLRRHPEGSVLSFYAVKKLVRELSGIVEVKRDMCDNSCIGYTGAYRELDACPYCGESRYEPCPQSGPGSRTKHPRKQFTTLLLGPQIQAQRRGPETSHLMQYRQRCTEAVLEELNANEGVRTSPYRDYIDGAAYLEAVDDGRISPDDSVVVLSMDGAMLYRNKTSDCWIYIWLFMNYDVDVRYKKRFVAIGGTIPGPNKIRNADSFLFTGLHHVAAIQKEGLTVWDAATQRTVTDRPFLHLVTADGPAMAYLDGFVGHHGRIHCRFYCPIVGRHKLGGPHYYPARLRPHNYQVTGCDHDDVDLVDLLASHDSSRAAARYSANLVTVINSPNMSRYEKNRLETGIVKPSIFSGLPPKRILGIPAMFGGDAMHLPTLNIPDLYISLWRATMDCDTRTDDKRTWPFAVLKDPAHWKVHGKHVGDAIPFTPGSFDRPSRNPAEKISSGYKAWEFLLYFYGHCPCLLFGLLPEAYYVQFCKLARAVRILIEENITPEELAESDELMTVASNGFEELYVQRRADRLHFVRASVHAPSHMPGETERLGPGMIYSQYTMERTIGNLGEEIKQHSNPYANLSERAVRRCQINALKALVPEIEPPTAAEFPASARVLGDGYALLPRRDKITRPTTSAEGRALYAYLEAHGASEDELASIQTTVPKVRRWARLRLPNGQTARSRWKEEKMGLKVRMSRNVKINTASGQRFGEVHYYTLISVNNITHPVAVVSLYGPPHEAIYRLSSKMYVTMQHHRDVDVHVVDARSIASVVLLAPDPRYPLFFKDGSALNRYYLVERPGLGMLSRIGYNYEAPDDGSDNELD